MTTSRPQTILLVDDSSSVVALYASALEREGFRVLKAYGSEQAVRLAQDPAQVIDVLATDIVLPAQLQLAKDNRQRPSMHGLALMRRVLKLRPSVRVILFSGQTDETLKGIGHIPSGIPFLRKPFSAEVLIRTVRQQLETTKASTVPLRSTVTLRTKP